jgi:hypothetical protein
MSNDTAVGLQRFHCILRWFTVSKSESSVKWHVEVFNWGCTCGTQRMARFIDSTCTHSNAEGRYMYE